MAQTTQITIDNQTFPSFRSKLNESLSALNTLNSGTSRPSSAVAGTIWLDTTNATNPTLKFYDGADDISLATIDYSANTVNWLDSSVSLTSPVEISGNSTAGAEIRLPEDTDNGSNYVGLKASDSIASNITFTLPNADGTSGQALKTDGSGNLSFGDAGRLGTVNWDTTPKTATFSAVSGNGYFCNTSGGAFTVNLPAGSPEAIVSVADYSATWQTNNLTVTPNGTDKIGGVKANVVLNTEGQSVTFVYVDSTQGWINTMDSTSNERAINTFVLATGGTITECGDYKIHTFTGPGTFTVTNAGTPAGSTTVDYMVVAGGGGGTNGNGGGGGGGAGGYRESSGTASGCYSASPLGSGVSALPVSVTGYPVTVGAGGTGSKYNTPPATAGSNSVFSTITSAGGGFGAQGDPSPGPQNGGSGGGGSYTTLGGTGNTPPVSPPQGNNGGNGFNTPSGIPAYGGGQEYGSYYKR
jgi:hypothetical protein